MIIMMMGFLYNPDRPKPEPDAWFLAWCLSLGPDRPSLHQPAPCLRSEKHRTWSKGLNVNLFVTIQFYDDNNKDNNNNKNTATTKTTANKTAATTTRNHKAITKSTKTITNSTNNHKNNNNKATTNHNCENHYKINNKSNQHQQKQHQQLNTQHTPHQAQHHTTTKATKSTANTITQTADMRKHRHGHRQILSRRETPYVSYIVPKKKNT